MEQPSGTVTLLFTDIEGSTRLLDELGPEGYREALTSHRKVLREAFDRHGGYEVDYEGDAFFVAFREAAAAVAAAREAQTALADSPVRVRMGLHTGMPLLDPPKYVGKDVHLAARVMGAGHGGQILLSAATAGLVVQSLRDLSEHRLKDFAEPVSLFQLGDGVFPPLKTISNTNLPRPALSFVGREREVDGVVALIRGGARLVTLAGPGGSGKTRLAIEAAAELVPEFKASAFWVGLSALRDPALVLETIAQSLRRTATLRGTSPSARCSFCSTTWNRSWRRHPRWRPSSRRVRTWCSSSPHANCYGRLGRSGIRCCRSTHRRRSSCSAGAPGCRRATPSVTSAAG